MTKTAKIIISLGTTLLAVIILYFMLRSFSWQEIAGLIKALSWSTGIIFIGFLLAISLIKSARFFIFLKSTGVKSSFTKIAMIFITSQAFTPFPGGEVGRAFLFKNKLHIEMGQVAAPVFFQAITELWTATFLALICVFFIKFSFGPWLIIILLFLLAILTTAVISPQKLRGVLNFFKNHGLKYKWLDEVGQLLKTTEHFVLKKNGYLPWQLWILIILLAVAGHLVAGSLIWYIASLQAISLTIFQSIFAAVAAGLISSIFAIIPGGLGVTEGGLLGVFISFGLKWNKAVIITLLYRVLTFPVVIIIALLFLLLIYLPNIFHYIKNKV